MKRDSRKLGSCIVLKAVWHVRAAFAFWGQGACPCASVALRHIDVRFLSFREAHAPLRQQCISVRFAFDRGWDQLSKAGAGAGGEELRRFAAFGGLDVSPSEGGRPGRQIVRDRQKGQRNKAALGCARCGAFLRFTVLFHAREAGG